MPHTVFYPHRRAPSPSNPNRGSTGKPSRPALHRKGTSLLSHSISKLGSGQPKRLEKEDSHPYEMASSFLNFCAMCERQITVPDNSLLYCSESCRRKDSCKPLSASVSSGSSTASLPSPPWTPPTSPPIIVAPMTPTKPPVIRVQSENHDPKPDLDPTEGKPAVPMHPAGSNPVASSDAWNFLSKFHEEPMLPRSRPIHHRRTTSQSTMSISGPLPSLIHTPPSMASSFSSNASEYMNSLHDSANRPLPPRHNPNFSISSSMRSVDLVVPHFDRPAEDDTKDDANDDKPFLFANSSVLEDTSNVKTPTGPPGSMPSGGLPEPACPL
ncbi:hypothetical protein PHISCL_08963 [Aspergillus sclerotialis]|uniref:Life-span regulatory factor n=1 Tax=Aspergillus sclerotialis TaxID=2070753 RepID=A0A3A2ZLE3_9EURO|nr:hypothetical protein PHISCL_08963 [Aspergillus sclerotialis]